MDIREDVSPQDISWVKSDIDRLSINKSIRYLYYPDTVEELVDLISTIRLQGESFDVIGYSSNTLFLPTYTVRHLICTKKIRGYTEYGDLVVCECGVAVAPFSKKMVESGYAGFEGLTDLPGTIAAAVYGNCGCRGCSVNSLLHHIDFLKDDGTVTQLTCEDLKLKYRSTIIKRGEISGVILRVYLKKIQGDVSELMNIASRNHQIRKITQPSGENNLGTTFNGGNQLTFKGFAFKLLEKIVMLLTFGSDSRDTFSQTLKLIGKKKFLPYVYYWNRYMFLDEKSHDIFNEYYAFLTTLYKDISLEIEIRK